MTSWGTAARFAVREFQRPASLQFSITILEIRTWMSRSPIALRLPESGGRSSARRLNASLMPAPGASVSLICKAGTSFETLVSASALALEARATDRGDSAAQTWALLAF